jgi:hypothetical protein
MHLLETIMKLVASFLSRSLIGLGTRDLETINAHKQHKNKQHKYDYLHSMILRPETDHLLSSQPFVVKDVITENGRIFSMDIDVISAERERRREIRERAKPS